jgi:hypothetical protein
MSEIRDIHGQFMARAKTKSLSDIFWSFVEEHPEAAAGLAFQLGTWAGAATDTKKAWKTAKNFPSKIHDTLPQSISEAALRLLPSPGLQPPAEKNASHSSAKMGAHASVRRNSNGQKKHGTQATGADYSRSKGSRNLRGHRRRRRSNQGDHEGN